MQAGLRKRCIHLLRRLKQEDGQALIETYLSSALLIVLLLGAAEFGTITYAATELSNAARAAAQYAAMNGGAFTDTGLDTTGMLLAAQTDAGNLASTVQFATPPTYTCACTGAGTAVCGAPPSGCNESRLLVTVKVQLKTSINPLVFVPGFTKSSITLYGSDQQVVLQ
jgi:Flp pilus assembly protein TadG